MQKPHPLVRWMENFIVGVNSTKYWFAVNISEKFSVFTVSFML